ncbi:hypothetical protein ACHHV8_11210 [Paenibacillus sp. TAB 01]|uniref:hypothetical protein n=1 Tax=Paenibacillus sp. TAB 01 TaxID=3368988 RepID=UPI0037520804
MAEDEHSNIFRHRYGIEVLNDLQEVFLMYLKEAIHEDDMEYQKEQEEKENKNQHQISYSFR